MKLKGHTDNVKSLLLNRDGTQVKIHTTPSHHDLQLKPPYNITLKKNNTANKTIPEYTAYF